MTEALGLVYILHCCFVQNYNARTEKNNNEQTFNSAIGKFAKNWYEKR